MASTSTSPISWNRLSIEAAVIVVSILLAFAIDAWWADKQERRLEQATLQNLKSDFLASRDEMAIMMGMLEEARSNFAYFQSASTSELAALEGDSIGLIINSLVIAATYDPVSGTLDALVGDGRLGLINDPALRKTLSDWRRALDDIQENSTDLRSEAQRVHRAMEPHGGPFHISVMNERDLAVVRKANAATLLALRQDAVLMGKARSHHFTISLYLRELYQLGELLEKIIAMLDQMEYQN
jgi:hypothetical protein